MKKTRFLAGLLALALTVALALPVGAAGSSFSDITDETTALNADILRLMGVVDGVGGGRFNPSANLTRAEFCTMVVKFLQRGDEVSQHTSRTIFSDVTAKHWGLGYVNLAASIRVGEGDAAAPLISGVGDGRFEPDAKLTLAQGATILLRVLGYTSQQTGSLWPQSYLDLARSIGLLDDVSAGTYDNLTRAQAAQLFVNALNCDTGSGTPYYENIGTGKDKVIVLAVNVTTDDGTKDGAIRMADGGSTEAYLPAAGQVVPTSLVGRRGRMILNGKSELVTFLPDDSTSVTCTLSGAAQPSYVKDTDGKQYTMNKETILYTASSREGSAYTESYATLTAGTQVTLFSEKGKITAVYASGSAEASTDAVIVSGTPTAAMFHQLTDGATDFTVRKGQQNISLSQLATNDVVTYDRLSNTLLVSDLKLGCVYEDASPNAKAPTSITAMGHEFPVLDCAWDSISQLSLGDNVVLLLTTDGSVAGMLPLTNKLRSNAIGVLTGDGAAVYLPDGGQLTLTGEVSNKDRLADQVVTISSTARGKISASRLSSASAPGALDMDKRTLGNLTLTAGARVYEQAGSAMVELNTGDIAHLTVPANKIAAYHANSSNMVDYVVLDAVTGDAYRYGMMVSVTTKTTDEDGEDSKDVSWKLTRGSNTVTFGQQYTYNGKSGDFVGVVVGVDSSGAASIRSVTALTAVKNVSPAQFFESQGLTYVSVSGKTYQVADGVECYRSLSSSRYSADNWFQQSTGAERLAACKAFSDNLTLYVDPVGNKVRIIVAN